MKKKLKTLELFAGSRSFSKVAEQNNLKTYTTDIKPLEKIDQVCDIFEFDPKKAIQALGGTPDVIWASPPCTYFSVASIGYHWNKDNTPKTKEASLGISIIERTIDIIRELSPKLYFIENPIGKLRKIPIMDTFEKRLSVTYCSYGNKTMKPTDIWTNSHTWTPREMCKAGNRECHHEPAPRGSSKGTYRKIYGQAVPEELCLEIIESFL